MGIVVRDLNKNYGSGNAKSWYDSTFKVLMPIEGTNVTFYQSYMRNRNLYKKNINLSGTVIKINLALGSNPGSETTESQVFSGYDATNKIKLDVFLSKAPTGMNIKIVYSTQASTTVFTYLYVASGTRLAYQVIQLVINTSTLTATGSIYNRVGNSQPITNFTFNKQTSTVITFDSLESIASLGADAVTLATKLSEYGRLVMIHIEIDEIPRFNVAFNNTQFVTGSIIENVSGDLMITLGGSYTNSKLPVSIEACNVHNG